MAQVVPAILESTLLATEDKIKILDGLTDWVEIDVCDGQFVPNFSWGNPDDIKLFRGEIKISAHLMVNDPADVLPAWQEAADRVVVHLETAAAFQAMSERLEISHNGFGLALRLETPLSKLEKWLGTVSYFQLLAIERLGYQGEKFDDRVLGKISDLRQRAPNATIAVDGGLTLETGKKCLTAGADILIVGSAIWQTPDPIAALKSFQALS